MNSPVTDLRPTLISIHGLSFNREGRSILRDIDLEIKTGDFVVITGPNGGGKTTLLRMILGLQSPDSGKIQICENLKFGYLPQKSSIDSHFPITVGEVVESALLAVEKDSGKRIELCTAALADVEMTDLGPRPIGRLSGGQLQRALIARALVNRPDILVLDEPMSYLDRHAEELLIRILGREKSKGTTILMVTHQQSAVSSLATSTIYIDGTLILS